MRLSGSRFCLGGDLRRGEHWGIAIFHTDSMWPSPNYCGHSLDLCALQIDRWTECDLPDNLNERQESSALILLRVFETPSRRVNVVSRRRPPGEDFWRQRRRRNKILLLIDDELARRACSPKTSAVFTIVDFCSEADGSIIIVASVQRRVWCSWQSYLWQRRW